MICSPVSESRWTSRVGSSSSSRRIALAAFSSSPLVLGSKAKAITGAGRSSGGEDVAGAGLLELGDRPDVAGAQLLHLLVLLAVGNQQRPQALLGTVGDVGHLGVGLDRARVDAEQVDSAG